MSFFKNPFQVEVLRGDHVESRHDVHLVVLDEKNRLVESFGDPDFKTFPRSAIKPMQAFPFLNSGAIEKFDLSETEIVLSCASHQGEDFHIEAVQKWAAKMGVRESDLACGPQQPGQTRWMNNCSGKHLGFIATALMNKEPIQGYHLYDHPVQQRVIKAVCDFTGIENHKDLWAVDGCGIPTGYFPLQSWVRGLGVFFSSQNVAGRSDSVNLQARRILHAIQKHPQYLGGTNNISSDLIAITEGKMIVKSGAEAFYLGFWPEKRLSFGFKIEDGSSRAVSAVLKFLVQKYLPLSPSQWQQLESKLPTTITNTLGEVVGQIQTRT